MIPRQVIDLIKAENALVKVVSSPKDNDEHWHFLLGMLTNPCKVRPVKSLTSDVDRTIIWDPRDGKWGRRKVHGTRGHAMCWTFTKKTATTLLPSNGMMRLFPALHGVAIIFDINECWLGRPVVDAEQFNGKFIFKENSITDDYWWLYKGTYRTDLSRSVSLGELRRYNKQAVKKGIVLNHNELLSRLGEGSRSVKALGSCEDNIISRLNTQRIGLLVKEELGLPAPLPLLILTPTAPVKIYSNLEQTTDLLTAVVGDGIQAELARDLLQHPDIAKKLHANLPKLTPDKAGTILCNLLKNKEYELSQNILKHCNKINLDIKDSFTGYTALHFAVIYGYAKLIAPLCGKEASPSCENPYNKRTPLSIALYNGSYNLVKLLINHAPWSSFTRKDLGKILLKLIKKNQFDLARFLYSKKFKSTNIIHTECGMDFVDSRGYTALHYAVIKNQPELVRSLCEYGANVLQKNNTNSRTPLSISLFNNYDEISYIMLLNNLNGLSAPEINHIFKETLPRKIGIGFDMQEILDSIHRIKNTSKRAQVAVLFSINIIENVTAERDVLELINKLKPLHQEVKSSPFYNNVVWSHIHKMAKNRILRLNLETYSVLGEEVKDFLREHRRNHFSFFKTKSTKIAQRIEMADVEKAQEMLSKEESKEELWTRRLW